MISQTIGAFNDNAMKAMLPLMAAVQFGKASMDTVNQQVSILLIVPFVLFAPIAGWVTDRFSKKKVIVTALLGQLLGLGVLGIALYWQSLEFSLAGFFILSVQSAFFSPAKKGILKELIGTQRLAKAVGFMEMLAMVGILGGAFAGAVVFDQMVENRGGWGAALLVCGFISILAFISWVIAWPIPDTAVAGTKPFKIPLMVNHFHDLLYLLRRKELRYAALGDAWFWGVGGFFYLVLVKISGEVVAGKVGMGTLYGFWFLLLGIGIMLGSIFVAYLNRGRIEIGLSAIGAIGMPIVFMGFCISEPLSDVFSGLCLSLGFFGALFFVPLNGYIQDRADQNERGRVLACFQSAYSACWYFNDSFTCVSLKYRWFERKGGVAGYFYTCVGHWTVYSFQSIRGFFQGVVSYAASYFLQIFDFWDGEFPKERWVFACQ
jgi:acyl-[acyl-carrier-protein]-phospholipid O-acyltransferase/long-chain-fatty-acid--[acyl-carrier-protein] ligase